MRRPQKATRPPKGADDDAKDVLIVEADPEQQVALAYTLRCQGHRVVATSSAAGAIALTEHFPVDLVLVSQELPRTTGVDVTRSLSAERPGIRIVVIAAEGGPGLKAAAQRAGAHDCVARDRVAEDLHGWLSEAEPAIADDFDVAIAAQSAE